MKKAMTIKPLAAAMAFAAGSSVSMIAVALPGGGDTLGAAGVVNESICTNSVDMTITGGVRTVTTGTGDCQLRTLPPTKGFELSASTPAGSSTTDSSALVSAGGELYEAYVSGQRLDAVLLTPNRALATSRAVEFISGANGEVTSRLAVTVQPSTGLQSSWLTGTYTVVQRQHNWSQVASGLETSVYTLPGPNKALGERNYNKAVNVTFNGDGTCTVNDVDTRMSFALTKDPLAGAYGPGEYPSPCTAGGGSCGQNDGNNYIAQGVVNTGKKLNNNPGQQNNLESDWMDQGNSDGDGLQSDSCTYTVSGGQVTVNYDYSYGTLNPSGPSGTSYPTITHVYNVSADLRYLVSDNGSALDNIDSGGDGTPQKGGIAVGVRVGGAASPEGKTYLFNAMQFTNSASTPTTAEYENPQAPANQEEECVSRGSLAFAAAGACTYDVVSTCSGRSKSGYEESAAGAADGTVSDSLTVVDGAPAYSPTCSWSQSGSDLTVNVGVQDPEGNPITVVYDGSVADNGEALVMMGEYAVAGAAPDVQNVPLLVQQKFNIGSYLIAQEYTGDLGGDADSDGTNNKAEFTWALDMTPAGGVDNDFDASGVSDILWTRASDGVTQIWQMTGNVRSGQLFPPRYNLAFTHMGNGDFNGDGIADVLWRNLSTGQNTVWLMAANGTKTDSYLNAMTAANTVFKGIGDFDGDGDDDILWRDTVGGSNRIWVMQGGVRQSESYLQLLAAAYEVRGIGDFNNDGVDDIFWHRADTGATQVWNMAGNVRSSQAFPPLMTNTSLSWMGAGDTDGDGDDDLLLRNLTSGQNQLWVMENSVRQSQASLTALTAANTNYMAMADFDGDGDEDIFWRDVSGGANRIWVMQANARSSESYLNTMAATYTPKF